MDFFISALTAEKAYLLYLLGQYDNTSEFSRTEITSVHDEK